MFSLGLKDYGMDISIRTVKMFRTKDSKEKKLSGKKDGKMPGQFGRTYKETGK